MNIPDWVQRVLSSFEGRTEPYREVEITDALGAVRKHQGDLSEEDWKGFLSEYSAFLFLGQRNKDSVWGTYFAPMMSAKKSDGSDLLSPDIKTLDADAVSHWERRATTCHNPVMRARYGDLVWDLKRAITGEPPSPEYACIAIDSYREATDKKFYPMEVDGIQWLERALHLTLSINDSERKNRLVEFMFEFYDRVAQTQFAGTWLFLFDNL
jgi:lysyl-tRNA synthetase class 1